MSDGLTHNISMEEWKYRNKSITKLSQMPTGTMGFIYIIETSKGDMYVGRKQVLHTRKRKLSKKKIAEMKDKRLSKFKEVTKESDWRNYTGSSKRFSLVIQSGVPYTKTILKFCKTKAELSYYEAKYQFKLEVLENDKYYNDNIGDKYYRSWLK